MDAQSQELNSWDKAVEKIVNTKIKAWPQPASNIQKINAKYLWGYKQAKKEDKNSEKYKFTNIPPTDIPSRKQLFSTHQNHKRGFWHHDEQKQGQGQNSLITALNATIKKEKDKKNSFQIICYNDNKKGHYGIKKLKLKKNKDVLEDETMSILIN